VFRVLGIPRGRRDIQPAAGASADHWQADPDAAQLDPPTSTVRRALALLAILATFGAAVGSASQRAGLPGDGEGGLAALVTRAVDLNRADAVELASLPGVGPALARKIVEDRASRGPFRSLADLDRVRGIGPSHLRRLAGKAGAGSGEARPATLRPPLAPHPGLHRGQGIGPDPAEPSAEPLESPPPALP